MAVLPVVPLERIKTFLQCFLFMVRNNRPRSNVSSLRLSRLRNPATSRAREKDFLAKETGKLVGRLFELHKLAKRKNPQGAIFEVDLLSLEEINKRIDENSATMDDYNAAKALYNRYFKIMA